VIETAPWWGVPVIAGGFLLLGGTLTFLYTYLNDRRKSRLEDNRRFETEIIQQYEALDGVIEQIHQTEPPDRSDAEDVDRYMAIYWPLYMKAVRANQRLEIVAPRSIYSLSRLILREVNGFFPRDSSDRSNMVALVEAGDALLKELRVYLRIRDCRRYWQDWPVATRIIRRLPMRWQMRLLFRRKL